MSSSIRSVVFAAGVAFAPLNIAQAQEDAPTPILFTNVDVFDGFSPELIIDANVLVEGNVITQVSTDPIEMEGAFVVDGTGKTMTPGLIDMHQHVMLNAPEGTAREPVGAPSVRRPRRAGAKPLLWIR